MKTWYRGALLAGVASGLIAVGFGVGGVTSVALVAAGIGVLCLLAATHLMLRVLLSGMRDRTDRLLEPLESRIHAQLKQQHVASERRAAEIAAAIRSLSTHDRSEALLLQQRELLDRVAALRSEQAALADQLGFSDERAGAVMLEAQGITKKLDEAAARSNRLRAVMLEGFRATRVNIEYAPQAIEQYRLMRESLAEDRKVMPLTGGWALSAGAITEIVARIEAADSHPTVLELGSGVSTVWISRALQARGGGTVVSLEHAQEFLEGTAATLREDGAPEFARLVLAPLQPTVVGDEEYDWYDLSNIADLSDVDFLVVDGPLGKDGKLTRLPALPMLMSKLRPGAVVVLDDTIRHEERQIVARWTRDYPGLVVERRLEKATIMRWNG